MGQVHWSDKLNAPVSFDERYLPLDAWATAITQKTRVPVQIAPSLTDRKIVLVCKDRKSARRKKRKQRILRDYIVGPGPQQYNKEVR